jgi:hypothetical protein
MPLYYQSQIRVDVFSASGSYTKPSWARKATIKMLGAMGGGGSGRRGAAGTARFGGGGAGAAVYLECVIRASEIDATGSVIIGAGGIGGAAITTNDTDGAIGTAAGNTSVNVNAGNGFLLQARGSQGGNGGTSTSGIGGSVVNGAGIGALAQGGSSNVIGQAGQAQASFLSSSGAAGGGISSANVAFAGGTGVNPTFFNGSGRAGGIVDGALPSAGLLAGFDSSLAVSIGGGGGAASITTAAQAGANFGAGGGASANGFNSGAGANGHSGLVVIIWEG